MAHLVGAYGAYKEGEAASVQAKSQAAIADYNAKVAAQEQKAIAQKADFDSRRQAEEASRVSSSIQSGLGVSGVQSTAGAPLAIQAEQAKESELDNLLIGYEAQIREAQAKSQQNLFGMQSKIYGQQARSAMTAGYLRAGSTLLTGFEKAAMMGAF